MALALGKMPSSGNVPLSVAQITQDAQNYEFNALVPLKVWLRSAANMLKQAEVYTRERDDEMVYFLLFRHAHLILSNLATHSEWNKASPEAKLLQKQVQRNLATLDEIKPRINRRHEEYLKAAQARQARREEDIANHKLSQTPRQAQYDARWAPISVQQVRGQEHSELAARLAGQEFSRRGLAQQSDSISSERENRTDLTRTMQAIRSKVDASDSAAYTSFDRQHLPSEPRSATGFNYPNVPHTQNPSIRFEQPLLPGTNWSQGLTQTPTIPAKPPKAVSIGSSVPPRPEKTSSAAPVIPTKAVTEPEYSFAPSATLENGASLRTMFLPPTLRTTFLRLAYKNTQRNLETCGFLAGTLRANALFVNTLIVPEQISSSDTCEMTDESELFDYVDQNDLIVLGWIHTHPSQTCFMSSRDLHTHAGYQMMLAESIAVVCAPSKGDISHGGDWGAYRLTDPPGKMAILQCDKPGIFHPHEVDNIYTDAMKPGHVMEISGMDFQIVDLRHSQ